MVKSQNTVINIAREWPTIFTAVIHEHLGLKCLCELYGKMLELSAYHSAAQPSLTGMNSQHTESGTTVPSEHTVGRGAALATVASATRETIDQSLNAIVDDSGERCTAE